MRWIKNWHKFSEALEVKDSDTTDVKFSKEKMNTYEEWLSEYRAKKSAIDSIFKMEKDPKKREEKLKALIGKEESSPEKDRNPFLVKYISIAKMTADVDDINKKIINDKLQLKDFEDTKLTVKDEFQKKLLLSQIADTKNKITANNAKIKTISDNLAKTDSEIKKSMSDMQKEIDSFSKKIKSEGKK